MARGKVESDLAMRLDTGSISETDIDGAPRLSDGAFVANEAVPTLQSGPDLGRALKAIRESRGLSVGSSRVDLQACKLEYSIVSPK